MEPVVDYQPIIVMLDTIIVKVRKCKEGLKGIKEKNTTIKQVCFWLENLLRDGPMAAREVLDIARIKGISETTLRRAKRQLRVKSIKRKQMDSSWEWEMG